MSYRCPGVYLLSTVLLRKLTGVFMRSCAVVAAGTFFGVFGPGIVDSGLSVAHVRFVLCIFLRQSNSASPGLGF